MPTAGSLKLCLAILSLPATGPSATTPPIDIVTCGESTAEAMPTISEPEASASVYGRRLRLACTIASNETVRASSQLTGQTEELERQLLASSAE